MNPVVGIDVAKGESEIQAFLDKGKPYGKSFSIKHNREELDGFIIFLGEIKSLVGQMPVVILESTGHYHTPIIQCLEENDILYILLNPIISHQAKKSSLRKVKTEKEEITITVSSMRLDNIVSELAKCSRSKALEYLVQERVFVNFEVITKQTKEIKELDRITIRGKGRFEIKEILGNTRKGNIVLKVEK